MEKSHFIDLNKSTKGCITKQRLFFCYWSKINRCDEWVTQADGLTNGGR